MLLINSYDGELLAKLHSNLGIVVIDNELLFSKAFLCHYLNKKHTQIKYYIKNGLIPDAKYKVKSPRVTVKLWAVTDIKIIQKNLKLIIKGRYKKNKMPKKFENI